MAEPDEVAGAGDDAQGAFTVILGKFGYIAPAAEDDAEADSSKQAVEDDDEAGSEESKPQPLANDYEAAWAQVSVEFVDGQENSDFFATKTAALGDAGSGFKFNQPSQMFDLSAARISDVANQSIVVKIFSGEVAPNDSAADTLLGVVRIPIVDVLDAGYVDSHFPLEGLDNPYGVTVQVSTPSAVQEFCAPGRFLRVQNAQVTLTPQDPSTPGLPDQIASTQISLRLKSLAPPSQPDEVEFVDFPIAKLQPIPANDDSAADDTGGDDTGGDTNDEVPSSKTPVAPPTDYVFSWDREQVIFLDEYAVDRLVLDRDQLRGVAIELVARQAPAGQNDDGANAASPQIIPGAMDLSAFVEDTSLIIETEFPSFHDALLEADFILNSPFIRAANEPAAASAKLSSVAPRIDPRAYDEAPSRDPHKYLLRQIGSVVDTCMQHCDDAVKKAGNRTSASSTKALRQAVYDSLNTSGEYYQFKEKLKSAMIRYAKTYAAKQRGTGANADNIDLTTDAFATDLYSEILRVTNGIVNERAATGRIPIRNSLEESTPSVTELSVRAYEAEHNGNLPLARSLHTQITSANPLLLDAWLAFAKFSLAERAYARAADCLRHCVGLDASHAESLQLYGAYLISDGAYDQAEVVLYHALQVPGLRAAVPTGDVTAALLAVSVSCRQASADGEAEGGANGDDDNETAAARRSPYREWRVIQMDPLRAAAALAGAAELCVAHGLEAPAEHAVGLAAEIETTASAEGAAGSFDEVAARRKVVRGQILLRQVRDAHVSADQIARDEVAAHERQQREAEAAAAAAAAAQAQAEQEGQASPNDNEEVATDVDGAEAPEQSSEPLSAGENLLKAEECFSAALELDDEFPSALDGLGHVFFLRGKLVEAAQFWEQSVSIRAEFAEEDQELQNQLTDESSGEEKADALLSSPVARSHVPVEVYMPLGQIYFASGDYAASKQVWLRCCCAPYTPTATTWLGVALASDRIPGSLEETRGALIEANRLDKTNPKVWGQLALNCFRRGSTDGSARNFELGETALSYALKFGLRDADTLFELGLCYKRSEQYSLAEELLRRSLFERESSQTRVQYAQVLLAQNRDTEALQQYKAALERGSPDPELARRVGRRINELVGLLGQ
eukprot:INCI20181.1.p1 GENE.INCI20181.1~~INCI20181.1.p1  ORF type:complete len:1132 (-),score=245.05 INCI20181.1:1132-4527(-)